MVIPELGLIHEEKRGPALMEVTRRGRAASSDWNVQLPGTRYDLELVGIRVIARARTGQERRMSAVKASLFIVMSSQSKIRFIMKIFVCFCCNIITIYHVIVVLFVLCGGC